MMGGSAPKEENGRVERRFDEEGDDTERRMLADPSTPRNLSHPIESKHHFDDAEAPSLASTRTVSFRDPAHSIRDKKSSSSLLREMEKREQEELRVQTEAIHVLEADEGTGEHETHGKWHDRFLPKNMMKQVSQWANKRRKWEAGETFGDASWNAHTAALCTSATSVVNVEETMNVFAYLDKNRDGSVDVEELLRAGESPYVRRLLRSTRNFVLVS